MRGGQTLVLVAVGGGGVNRHDARRGAILSLLHPPKISFSA
jgi:hypothetical protein